MMGKLVKITCDGCGRDLTTRSNSVDYRLVLGAESKPGYGDGAYTAMMIYPPVDRTYYFCDLQCLDCWRGRENHKNELRKAWWDKWKNENGTKHEEAFGGCVFSYPEPSLETRVACEEEFETAALAAFPMKSDRDV